MRPIERGPIPIHPETGVTVDQIYTHYAQYRGHLKRIIGEYCSYCERRLEGGVQLEHIRPKSKHKHLELDWNNFLLACGNCNPRKGDTDVQVDQYLWPDQDDTHLAFSYSDGLVSASDTHLKDRAERMIELVGLDQEEDSNPFYNPALTDERHFYRLEAWNMAVRFREQLAEEDTERDRANILTIAKLCGYWSIWVTVFREDPDMMRRLIESFPGTSLVCYETDTYQSKSRHSTP